MAKVTTGWGPRTHPDYTDFGYGSDTNVPKRHKKIHSGTTDTGFYKHMKVTHRGVAGAKAIPCCGSCNEAVKR